jgi:ubiquinone/menaquinone biosynthesis C-methylase UbiE
MLTKGEVTGVYRKRAKNYNFATQLYYLLGFRINSYREQAIKLLRLKGGDTVVDVGCGTGANFPMLQERVGQNGKIIGVDFTDAMLAKARDRVERSQWRNVELVQSDAASYQFPETVDGVISTFAIIYVPEFDDVIRMEVDPWSPAAAWSFWTSNYPTAGLRVSLVMPSSIPDPGIFRWKWRPAILGSR